MLRIKYIESFQNNAPYLVILANREDLQMAAAYFSRGQGGCLDDPSITAFCDIASLTHKNLYITAEESILIARCFQELDQLDRPAHAYFNTLALGDDVEIIISCGEYEHLF